MHKDPWRGICFRLHRGSGGRAEAEVVKMFPEKQTSELSSEELVGVQEAMM